MPWSTPESSSKINIEGFFNNDTLPDTAISDNNIAGYILFGGSKTIYDQMVDAQYK